MKGLLPLFIGLFGTFAFSWVGLTLVPNMQIGHLDPQMDEEGTDVYPAPRSGMAERGRRVYVANGCVYCHSQQVRADYAASDIDRKWGERRSAPRDYVFDRPALLGKMRMGPDLANVGKRAPAEEESPTPAAGESPAQSAAQAPPPAANTPPKPAASPAVASPPPAPSASVAAKPSEPAAPAPPPANAGPAAASSPAASPAESETKAGEPRPYSAAWHHRHLYSPRSLNSDSDMPAYRFLYEKHPINGERSADAVDLTGPEAPPPDWEIVPTYDAKCLVAYLMSLDQSHPLKEVKSGPAPAASPPAAKGAK